MDYTTSIIQPKAGTTPVPLYIGFFFLIFWICFAIHPVNRMNWLVENILVILTAVILTVTYRKFRFSNLSYFLITLLLALHVLGAHYTYGGVPFSISIPGILSPTRNNFDRIVHFSWGLLITYPMYEFFLRIIGRMFYRWVYIISLNSILAASSMFELIEMWGSRIMGKELAVAYLGMQGDIWDAQEDIAMALYGSIITLGILAYLRYSQKKKKKIM